MENYKSILGHNIRVLRKEKGLNQEGLAVKLNIKRSNIAAYETKNVEPRLRIILDLAKFFDIDIAILLKEKLVEGAPYPAFSEHQEAEDLDQAVVDAESVKINEFISKSVKIKKVLVGFKSFYTFRKAKLKELTPKNEKIIFDIDNFILLMEDLINHNESMITLLSSNKK